MEEIAMVATDTRSTTPSTHVERIEGLIKKHKEEVARWRLEFGDPEEALSKFVKDRFVLEALIPDDQSDSDDLLTEWEDDDSDAW